MSVSLVPFGLNLVVAGVVVTGNSILWIGVILDLSGWETLQRLTLIVAFPGLSNSELRLPNTVQ